MHCALCDEELDDGVQPIFRTFHESCLPPCELCGRKFALINAMPPIARKVANGGRGTRILVPNNRCLHIGR
jgi:hypothetical protein